jgi:hypothetical protein
MYVKGDARAYITGILAGAFGLLILLAILGGVCLWGEMLIS